MNRGLLTKLLLLSMLFVPGACMEFEEGDVSAEGEQAAALSESGNVTGSRKPEYSGSSVEAKSVYRKIVETMKEDNFSDRDKMVLKTVKERVEPTQETGFYLMMQKITEELPADIDSDMLDKFLNVNYRNFITSPDSLKYHDVLRMRVRVYKIKKLCVANGGLQPHRHYWPLEKPVYEVWGVNADGKIPEIEPLCFYSPRIPAGLPEVKPSPEDEDLWKYEGKNVRVCNVVGVFYKIVEKMQEGNLDKKNVRVKMKPQMRRYPVLLSWWSGVEEKVQASRGQTSRGPYMFVLLISVVLAGALLMFVFLKKRITAGRGRSGHLASSYRPLRDVSQDDRMYENQEVDSELADAARAYRKEKGLDDPPGYRPPDEHE